MESLRSRGGPDFAQALADADNPSAPAPAPEWLRPMINQAASRYGVSPSVIESVMRRESAFDPRAVSPRGAMGLMQIMPATAAELGVGDPFDPASNIDGGTRYLRSMMDRFGDLRLALAAYNAGPEAVSRSGNEVPPYAETRGYVTRVLSDLGIDSDEYVRE